MQYQGHIQKYKLGGGVKGWVSFPPLHFPPIPIPSSPLPLEVGPLIQLEGLASAVSSSSGVWGGAPAEIEFCTF